MPYSLDTIKMTLEREWGVRVSKPALKIALEMPQFVPDVNRMIAVANNPANLATSTRYGVFIGMNGDLYQIEGGREFNHARLLTPEEIAKCF